MPDHSSSMLAPHTTCLRMVVGLFVCCLSFVAGFGPARATASEVPIAAYSFAENEGGVAEDSASSYDATIHGAAWTSKGRYGAGLEFDGENDYLSVPDSNDLDLTEAFTLEAWVRPAEAGSWSSILVKEDSSEAMPFGYALYGEADEEVPSLYLAENNSIDAHVDGAVGLRLGGWSHIAVTSDGEEAHIYVDGELDGTAPAVSVKATNGALRIGGSEALGYFAGVIDEVRLYDVVLTPQEIEEDQYKPIDPATGSSTVSVSAEGSLVEGGSEGIVSPSSLVKIHAIDMGGEGITQIDLLLDGELRQTIAAAEAGEEGARRWCEGESCHFSHELTPTLSDSASGPHTLSIRATNKQGYSSTEEYPVVFDPHPPELTLSGALAEADGGTLEGETANLNISASDGSEEYDSGVPQVTILVDGNVIDSETYICAPECPEPAPFSYLYDESEWGVGPHEVRVLALDRAGNETTDAILVNAEPEAVATECLAEEPSVVGAGASVSPAEAIQVLEEVVPSVLAPNENALNAETDRPIDPAIEPTDVGSPPVSAFGFTKTPQGGYVEVRPEGGTSIAQASCLLPTVTTSTAMEREEVPGAPTVISANSATETDTAIRATALGSVIVESFRGSAPETVSWELALRPEEQLVSLESGAVAIVDPGGIDLPPRELPAAPEDPSNSEALNQVDLQFSSAFFDTAVANNEIEGEVLGVIPEPIGVNSEGEDVPVTLSITEEGKRLTAVVPSGTQALILRTESSIEPLAMCAMAFSGTPSNYLEGCGPSPSMPSEERTWVDNGHSLLAGGGVVYSAFTPGGELSHEETLQIYVAASNGEVSNLTSENFAFAEAPSVSLDEEKLAFTGCTVEYEQCGIFTMNTDGSDLDAILERENIGHYPSFNANGTGLFFWDDTKNGRQLFFVKADGTNLRQVTEASEEGPGGAYSHATATPDGKYIVFSAGAKGLARLPVGAEKADWPEATMLTEGTADYQAVSPNSEFVIYTDHREVRRVGIEGEGDELIASIGNESSPWYPQYLSYSPSGTEISFQYMGRVHRMPAGGGVSSVSIPSEALTTLKRGPGSSDPDVRAEAEGAEERIAPLFLGGDPSEGFLEIQPAELKFCAESEIQALECPIFYADRSRALEMREKLFTSRNLPDRSTRGNAFQHGFWTALMVKSSLAFHYVKGMKMADGLFFALIHEGPPDQLDWDAQMDILNNFTGNKFWKLEGGVGVTEIDVCEALLMKGANARFLGANVSPFLWEDTHRFHFRRLVFRKLRSDYGNGAIVHSNGRTCNQTW